MKIAIYSEFSYWKLWYSIVMLVYQRVPSIHEYDRGKTKKARDEKQQPISTTDGWDGSNSWATVRICFTMFHHFTCYPLQDHYRDIHRLMGFCNVTCCIYIYIHTCLCIYQPTWYLDDGAASLQMYTMYTCLNTCI